MSVHHPDQTSRIGDDDIGIRIPLEETGEIFEPASDVPPDQHSALGSKVSGQQYVRVALLDRGCESQWEGCDRKAALAVIGGMNVVGARRVIELGLPGMYEYRLVHNFTVVNLRTSQFQAASADFGRHVLDQINGAAVRADLADLGQHRAVPVGVNKMRIDPAGLRLRHLMDIQFTRRKQNLPVLSIDVVAINVGIGKNVIGSQRLSLRDSVMERPPVPQPDIVQQVAMPGGIDARAGVYFELDLVSALFDGKRTARGMDVGLDVRTLQ